MAERRQPDPFFLLEAVASVSLSHDERCDCLTCRAASGDKQALGYFMATLVVSGPRGDEA